MQPKQNEVCFPLFGSMVESLHVDSSDLQSSPTGPAEHCAGGSLCKSFNSWNKTTSKTHTFFTIDEVLTLPVSLIMTLPHQKLRGRGKKREEMPSIEAPTNDPMSIKTLTDHPESLSNGYKPMAL